MTEKSGIVARYKRQDFLGFDKNEYIQTLNKNISIQEKKVENLMLTENKIIDVFAILNIRSEAERSCLMFLIVRRTVALSLCDTSISLRFQCYSRCRFLL